MTAAAQMPDIEGEKLDAADDHLAAAAECLAARDLDVAAECLADAVAALDALGAHDPATGRPLHLGTRLLAVCRDLARAGHPHLPALPVESASSPAS